MNMRFNNLAQAYGHFLTQGNREKADLAMQGCRKISTLLGGVIMHIPGDLVMRGLANADCIKFVKDNLDVHPNFAEAAKINDETLAVLFETTPLLQ